ncbi:hypothetical protein BAMY6639_10725 [Bacillus amyloliquefaciens UMAF6639]|nr:hypothetical protein BAMY6639_10725 [Bacillus amyloliquefaciens UMAF6639]
MTKNPSLFYQADIVFMMSYIGPISWNIYMKILNPFVESFGTSYHCEKYDIYAI